MKIYSSILEIRDTRNPPQYPQRSGSCWLKDKPKGPCRAITADREDFRTKYVLISLKWGMIEIYSSIPSVAEGFSPKLGILEICSSIPKSGMIEIYSSIAEIRDTRNLL